MPDYEYVKIGNLGFAIKPTFPTPYDFVMYYAPKLDWEYMKDISWQTARDMGMMDILARVMWASPVHEPLFISDPSKLIR